MPPACGYRVLISFDAALLQGAAFRQTFSTARTYHNRLDLAVSEHLQYVPDSSRSDNRIQVLLGLSSEARADPDIVDCVFRLVENLLHLGGSVDADAEETVWTE